MFYDPCEGELRVILPRIALLRINLDDNDFRVTEKHIHTISSCLSAPALATTAAPWLHDDAEILAVNHATGTLDCSFRESPGFNGRTRRNCLGSHGKLYSLWDAALYKAQIS